MKKILFVVMMGLFATALLWADDYSGWDVIRPLLLDGEGSEFVRPITGLQADEFTGASEFEAVQAAANWVSENYSYVLDEGEVWTSSDQMYARLTGDCEDWAILLCSLLRFHTDGGIPAKRVWVAINLVQKPGVGVYAAHAWVGYRLERGGMAHIEPANGVFYRGQPKGMLEFNDQTVKGGGQFLAGKPRGSGEGKK